MERLQIHDFGPISNADIEIRTINVFIGATSSGKSTAAKLIAILKGLYAEGELTFPVFVQHLKEYNIDFKFHTRTLIRYSYDDGSIVIRQNVIEKNLPRRPVFNPVYVPAERSFFATMSQSIFGLMANNISLPRVLINFGAQLEKARRNISGISVPFLNVEYEYDGINELIRLQDGNTLLFSQASSGLQSAIPLLLVVMSNIRPEHEPSTIPDLLVIEEPELNLFPSTQKALIELIIARMNESPDRIILTTHSPYLLTTLDNFVQANTVAALQPNQVSAVAKLVPKKTWIAYDRISCYFFEDGTCRSTLDPEMQSIGPSKIDDVSTDLSQTFEQLLTLKYP